jgi:hypothetical protein
MAAKTTAPPASTSQTKDPAIVERTDLQIKGARKKKESSRLIRHLLVGTTSS